MEKLKKYKKAVGVGSILLVLAILLGLIQLGVFSNEENTVRVYVLSGVVSMEGPASAYITPKEMSKILEESKEVGALVLRINSSGGSVVASQEILDSIRKFKEETGIPLVMSLGEVAASGGYYIALGGDVIIANPGTLTGSIGVISRFIYLEGLYEKLGLEEEIVKSGKYKGMGSKPLSREEQQLMQVLSDNIYEQFVREVARSRGLDIGEVRELATGEPYTGEQAEILGLVDRLGTLDDAIELARELGGLVDPNIKISYPGSSIFSEFLGIVAISLDKVSVILSSPPLSLRVSW